MAQHFTDFSGYSTGSFPQSGDPWTVHNPNSISHTFEIQSNQDATGGQLLYATSTGEGVIALEWDDVSAGSEIEVYVRLRSPTGSEHTQRPASRLGSGPVAYFADVSVNTGAPADLELALDGGSGFTSLAVGATSEELDDFSFYNVRIRSESDDTHQAWAWQSGSEPESPAAEATDSTLSSGTAGLWFNFSEFFQREFEIDVIGVGTNGDAAPTSEPVSTPTAPSNLNATLS